MLFWAVDNPAPANYLLISGDRDFSNALHQLRLRRYNILLAQPQHASHTLVAAAKSTWLWTSLLAGGPPLTNNELPQFINNSNYSNSGSFQSNRPAESFYYETTPPSWGGGQNSSDSGKGTETRHKERKQGQKNSSQPNKTPHPGGGPKFSDSRKGTETSQSSRRGKKHTQKNASQPNETPHPGGGPKSSNGGNGAETRDKGKQTPKNSS